MKLLNPNIPPHTVEAIRLRAVVFDWAGTTVDFGSLAPARTLQRLFAEFGVALEESEARRDMGLAKRDHISRILSMDRIRAEWSQAHGAAPVPADIDRAYERFAPLQFECLGKYSSVIEGVSDAVERVRSRGLRVGSSTGYTRTMLDFLLLQSAREGFRPDASLSPEDVLAGRPHPFMMFENAVRLQVYPMAAMVKVGDTRADIEEGLNAGAWSVGVTKSGNMVGLSKTDLDALPDNERSERLRAARLELEQAGAHYVIDTLDELDDVLDDITLRLETAAPVKREFSSRALNR